jgi:hypothetical protein
MTDYYKLLGIDRLESQQNIIKSIKNKKLELEQQIALGIGNEMIKSQLQSLDEAIDILTDADLREAYDIKLDNTPVDSLFDPDKPRYFDYSKHRSGDNESWKDVVNYQGIATVEMYRQLLRQTVKLPERDIQENILLSAIMTPTALASMLPIVFCVGVPGSGKSNIGKLACNIWGNDPMTGANTFSAIRRRLGRIFTAKDNGHEYQLNGIMVWDDISPQIMSQSPALYAALKSGYSRDTGYIEMAKKDTDDEIVRTNVFGLKLISSVHKFYADERFTEIARRMLVVHCAKSLDADDLIDLDSISWVGLRKVTNDIWEGVDGTRVASFKPYTQALKSYAQANRPLAPDRSSLCRDILATGLSLGIFSTVKHAYDELVAFYGYNDKLTAKAASMVTHVVDRYLKSIEADAVKRGLPEVYVIPEKLNQVIRENQAKSVIDRALRVGELSETMNQFGWYLDPADALWYKQ